MTLPATPTAEEIPARPRSAGALAFAPDGTLFVGDSKSGAIFAYPDITHATVSSATVEPFLFEDFDRRVAEVLKVDERALTFNGMAVHPLTREPYISVGIKGNEELDFAVLVVSLRGDVSKFDLRSAGATAQFLTDLPDETKTFRSRAGEWPVPSAEYYVKKGRTPMRAMAIVDMKFHNGELFVSGVSNQDFCSVLRRIPVPFRGVASETHIEIYHVSHGNYETRAPIRAMQFANLNGEDTLVAAYACSPIVTIPVADLKAGRKVIGKTIGDMGNGQPISMVAYRDEGEERLFITNAGRGPMVVSLRGLATAPAFTSENAPSPHMLLDLSPHMPAGPVGKQVMFVGSSLRADLISDRFFVSLTRESDTGGLTLETVPVGPLPVRLEKIWVEFDFPGGEYRPPAAA
jgi:hypothetical protein